MKKILSLLLALILVFSLTACLPTGSMEVPTQPTTEPTEATTEAPTEAPTEETTEAPTQETTEAVPENTQPPQGSEIEDPRPHPVDVELQNQQQNQATTEAATDTPTEAPQPSYSLDPNGHYTGRDEVALYIHLYGCLPGNYISKTQGNNLYGSYKNIPANMNIGGDRFGNREGLLPAGHTYYECDIGTSGGRNRGTNRIVYSTDGLVYYTNDHYASFTLLYGEP